MTRVKPVHHILEELQQRDLETEFQAIANRRGLLLSEVWEHYPSRPPQAIAEARHECWYLLRERGWSYPRIGALGGQDHSTVMAGVREHEKRIRRAVLAELKRGAA